MTSTLAQPQEGATTGRFFRRPKSLPALLVTLVGVAVILGYWRLVGYSTFTSDALGYWYGSIDWRQPVNPFHLPAYPWMVALARGASGGLFTPTVSMTVITVGALLAGVHATYALASEAKLSHRVSLAAASAFGLWPFVGIVYAALPVADPVALAALLWGTLFLLRRRIIPSGLALGLAAATHKAIWPTIVLLILGQLLVPDRRRAAIRIGAIASIPLLVLWIDGVRSGSPASWLLAPSADDATRPGQHALRYVDGLFGSMIYGDWLTRDRAVVAVGMVAVAAVLLVVHIRRRQDPCRLVCAVFAAQIVFMGLTLNQNLIWASVRFSGLLAVPAVWVVSPAIDECDTRRWRLVVAIVGMALVATQILSAAARASRTWGGVVL